MPELRLERETMRHFVDRLRGLGPQTPRPAQAMSPEAMMAHLRHSIEISLGEAEVFPLEGPLTQLLRRWLTFHILSSWPEGKLDPGEARLRSDVGDFDLERRRLLGAMDRFVARADAQPEQRSQSERFGELTLGFWCRVHARHFDYHLRELGV